MFPIIITNRQQVLVNLNPESEPGVPAPVDGVPTWEVLDGDSTVIPAADGMSATLRSSDTDGDTNIKVTADADMGSGVTEITDTIRLTVIDPQATGFGFTAGTPTPKT